MKSTPLSLLTVSALGAVLTLASPGIQADEIKYADLEKKLTVDKTPLPPSQVSYAQALEKVMPTVVTIFSSKTVAAPERNRQQEELFRRMFPDLPDDFFDRRGGGDQREQGLGSGVIISEDGYILTNNHVVGDADEIKVTLPSDKRKEYKATVVGADPQTDVALVKIDAKNLPHVIIGDSSALKIGDVVLAVGTPLGLPQTATMGIISAVGRNEVNILGGGYEDFIQTDAAINRGNSGGALVDAEGRLIGIPTAIQSNFAGGNIGIGFAIPSNMALNIVQRLLDGGGVVKRGFLGVFLRDLDANMAKALGQENTNGVLVAEVGEKTPAATAGMKPGDLIVGYNGKPVQSMQQLRLDISNTDPGTEVAFEIIRKGKKSEVKVKLGDLENNPFASTEPGKRPGAPGNKDLIPGVGVADLDEETRSSLQLDDSVEGVLVRSVSDDSPAAEAGLRPGMIITQIDQADVSNVADARKLIEAFDGDVLLVQVYAGGRRDILAIPLKE